MKKIVLLVCMVGFVFGLEIPKNHIVSTAWLDKNIDNKNLIVIDTRKKKAFEKGHIPKAINFPKKQWFKGKLSKIPKLYNTPEQTQDMMNLVGLSEDSIVVFYSGGLDQVDFADGVSGMWTFWMYGFKNSVILDGGFEKWQYENKKISKDIFKAESNDMEIDTFDKSSLASTNDILEAIYDEDIQISDARVAKFYRGEDDRKDLAKHGRIPSAKLTPMIRHLKKENSYYVFNTKEESTKILYNSGFGVELDLPLIVYCNTGHKARGLWFVSKFLVGMDDVKVYEGSMVEYTRTNLAIESGEAF